MREMRRVLAPDGIVGMSEPGRGHAASAPSVAEAAATGVLENELALEDIGEVALSCGFAAARVLVANRPPVFEIEAADLRPFMGGKGFARYWQALSARARWASLHPAVCGRSGAHDETAEALAWRGCDAASSVRMRHGTNGRLTLSVHNAGDTRWLAADNVPGWTRLGAHLYGTRRIRRRESTLEAGSQSGSSISIGFVSRCRPMSTRTAWSVFPFNCRLSTGPATTCSCSTS